jgi:hypothetical protein
MTDILYPSKSRRFMSEVVGLRRYHRNASRACAAARGGTLWVAVCKGWSCNPQRVAAFLAIIERQEREA